MLLKLFQTVQILPGLVQSLFRQVLEGMQQFSNGQYVIDLLKFKNVVDWMCNKITPNESPKLIFPLTVNRISGDNVYIVEVEISDDVTKLVLELRYIITFQVSENIFKDQETGNPWNKVLTFYP